MASSYPGTIDVFDNPSGTNTLNSPDHALQHTNVNSAVFNIETVMGTTSGTSVLKNIVTGDFVAAGTSVTAINTILGTTSGTSLLRNVSAPEYLISTKQLPFTYIVRYTGSTYYATSSNPSIADASNADLATLVTTLMTNLSSTGGEILLNLYGNHTWSTTVAPSSNVTVRGLGRGITKILVTAPYFMFGNTSSDSLTNFRCADYKVDVQGTMIAGGAGIQIYNCTGFQMTGVEMTVTTYTGPTNVCVLYSCTRIFIQDCIIHDTGGTGIFLQGCKYYRIIGNMIYNLGDNAIDCGTYTGVTDCGHGIVEGNVIYGNSGWLNIGAQSDVSVVGNSITDPRTVGINVGNDDTTTNNHNHNIVVSGNVITNPGALGDGSGINVHGASGTSQSRLYGVTITGNQVLNYATTGAPSYQDGITVNNGERCFIFGNTIMGSVPFKRDCIRIDKDGGSPQTVSGIAQYNYAFGALGTVINNASGGTAWITTTNFLLPA